MEKDNTLIKIKNLSVRYGANSYAVKDVSFDIVKGEFLLVVGRNGSGKSTLLNLIASKLGLSRAAPFNSSELFDAYAAACTYTLDCDDDGLQRRIPDGSRIISS